MAIKNRIHSMTDHLQEAYDVVAAKGGTLPANPNMQNLATTVSQLSYSSEAQDLRAEIIGLLQDTETVLDLRKYPEVTQLRTYIGFQNTNLTTVYLGNITMVPASAFDGCTNLATVIFSTATVSIGNYAFNNCTKFEDTELPHSLTNVGYRAFQNVGSNYTRGTHTFTMIDGVGVHTTIGDEAFNGSHLSKIDAYTNNIGSRAFQNCSSLTDVDLEIHGSIGAYAFNGCNYVENFEINANSVITSLGDNLFYNLALYTSAASKNILPFDFRNSVFTSISNNVWYGNKYDGVVYFPSTLAIINGNFLNGAQGNWKLYFNSVPTVPSSSYLRNNNGTAFTVKYYFPYDLLNQASIATNWSSHTSQMIGYGTGFEAGTALPEYTKTTGTLITWYSDDTLTTQITTSSSATDVYYCTVGDTRIVYFVDQPSLVDASVTISDGSNTYVAGDFIPVNTSITVTPSPTNPDKTALFLLRVNGSDYEQAGVATIVMDQDLIITCLYYDGVNPPFFSNLADNDWDQIKLASQLNIVPSTWHVGDTKQVVLNGNTYDARLVDTTGKLLRAADNTPAYLYFELAQLLPYAEHRVLNNTTPLAHGGETTLSIYVDGLTSSWETGLKNVLEPVKVSYGRFYSAQGTPGQTSITYEYTTFLPRVGDFWSYQAGVNSRVDEYYSGTKDNTDAATPVRCKAPVDRTDNAAYWCGDTDNGDQNGFYVYPNGGILGPASSSSAEGISGNSYWISVRFAL